MMNPQVFQLFLVPEEPFKAVSPAGILILLFKFSPVGDIRIMYPHFSAHLGKPPNN